MHFLVTVKTYFAIFFYMLLSTEENKVVLFMFCSAKEIGEQEHYKWRNLLGNANVRSRGGYRGSRFASVFLDLITWLLGGTGHSVLWQFDI